MRDREQDGELCPSARCEPDALLLGVVGATGRVDFLATTIAIDGMFVEAARLGRNPESRFRFASACAEEACSNWSGKRCGIADGLVTTTGGALPPCAIRIRCRWFAQVGRAACVPCRGVVTDTFRQGDSE